MPLLPASQAYKELGFPSAEALAKAAYRGTLTEGVYKIAGRWRFDVQAIKEAGQKEATRWQPVLDD